MADQRRCARIMYHLQGSGGLLQPNPAPLPAATASTSLSTPFSSPQVRSLRIRFNRGGWNPLVDMNEVFAGNHHPAESESGQPRLESPRGRRAVMQQPPPRAWTRISFHQDHNLAHPLSTIPGYTAYTHVHTLTV